MIGERKMSKWNLSDKEVKLDMCDCDKEAYWAEDIQEFIRRLKKDVEELKENAEFEKEHKEILSMRIILSRIDKLAGEKLR